MYTEQIYSTYLSDNKVLNISIIRKKIKNHYIRILPNLTVIACFPTNMSQDFIHSFIEKHKNWIEKNLAKYQNVQNNTIKDNLVNGGTVKILDTQYIVYISQSNKNSIIIDGFNIYINSIKSTDLTYVSKQYELYLKEQATKYFQNIINKYWQIFEKYNVKYPTLKVKPMRSKWGSCKPLSAQITLNLHLYKASASCIDYVVLHELTHLVHTGHKKRFYAFLQRHMPNYQEIEKQLDTEATQLLY